MKRIATMNTTRPTTQKRNRKRRVSMLIPSSTTSTATERVTAALMATLQCATLELLCIDFKLTIWSLNYQWYMTVHSHIENTSLLVSNKNVLSCSMFLLHQNLKIGWNCGAEFHFHFFISLLKLHFNGNSTQTGLGAHMAWLKISCVKMSLKLPWVIIHGVKVCYQESLGSPRWVSSPPVRSPVPQEFSPLSAQTAWGRSGHGYLPWVRHEKWSN